MGAADEIVILAVLYVFRHTFDLESAECLHFGRRTRGWSGSSAIVDVVAPLGAMRSGAVCWCAVRYQFVLR